MPSGGDFGGSGHAVPGDFGGMRGVGVPDAPFGSGTTGRGGWSIPGLADSTVSLPADDGKRESVDAGGSARSDSPVFVVDNSEWGAGSGIGRAFGFVPVLGFVPAFGFVPVVSGVGNHAKGAASGDDIGNGGRDRSTGGGTTGVGSGVGVSGGVGTGIGAALVGTTSVGGVGKVIGAAVVGFVSTGEAVGSGKLVVGGGVTGGGSSGGGGAAGGNIP